MSSSGRLLEILQILRSSRQPVTARAMANLLEVTQRTIYRDIATLQGLRIPVEGTAGIGYVLGARCALPPLNFSIDEIDAIVVGLSLLECTGDRALRIAASQVVQKIAGVLPDIAAADIESTPLRVWPWNTIPPSRIDVSIVRKAIRDEHKLEVQYTDAESRYTARTVRPIALIYYVESIVLAAWCELRQDFRHFRVDRLNACHPSAERFKGEGCRLRAEWQVVHWPISSSFQRASA
jgi:predicted DNA-binding transcriptional regulator YafY